MNFSKLILAVSATALLLLASCSKPIKLSDSVTIRNTLALAADPSEGGTGGAELPVETILGVPAGTFELNAEITDGIEFDDYLSGLYDVDLSKKAIDFELVAAANDPIYSGFFRTIEAGTFDRYYLNFPNGHKIGSGSSDNAAVSLEVLSDNEVVVVIGEGFSFNPGSKFSIELKK